MSATPPPPAKAAIEDIAALIEVLHQTGQRLEELTAGEVDTVSNRDGQTVVLRRAQESLRLLEASKRTAILDALPANIALLDMRGVIVAVNEGWRRFAGANGLEGPDHAVGVDYLAVCDRASGDDTAFASKVAAGIRSVLAGAVTTFSLEYPCDSPTQQRWFLMTVTPLTRGHPHGAVIMHLDITERKRTEIALRTSEQRLELALEAGQLGVWDLDLIHDTSWRSLQHDRIFGYESLLPEWGQNIFLRHVVSEDRESVSQCFEEATCTGQLDFECQITRADQDRRWIHARGKLYRDPMDRPVHMLGTVIDITARKRAEEALQDRAAELEDSQRIARIGSWAWAPATGVITWSDGMNDVLARDRALATPNFETVQQFYTPESWQRLGAAIANTIDTGAPYDLELEMIRADGVTCWTTTRGEAVRGADGALVKLRGTVHDITERRESYARIAYLTRVHAMLSGINVLIVRTRDREELFREACRVAVDAGGFRMALVGIVDRQSMKTDLVATAGKDESLLAAIKALLHSSTTAPSTMVAQALAGKVPVISNDSRNDPRVLLGKQYAESGIRSMALFPLIVSDEAVGVFALYAGEPDFFQEAEVAQLAELAGDIAFALDHLEKRERLDYLAYYDVLTGLANRTLFIERVGQHMRAAAAGGHKLALFLIDLERFKNVNDSLGRPAGDALLRQVANWLTQSTGDATLVARLGSDHFAVVLPEVKNEENLTRFVEEKMEAFLEHPFRLEDAVLRVAIKVGAALYPEDGADADTLFKNAEAALKKAKARGERYLFYTQAMTDRMAGTLTLENQLRRALDESQFVLHYQPKVNLASGKVTGVEALIRWNDPLTGLVPPGRFIPILEETGLILEVGRWALRRALDDYLRWRSAGLAAVRVAVNVSPLQLRHRDFIADIETLIGIDAGAAAGLELEITESLVMEDVKHSISSLRALRSLGVTIAVDDFGTGFSSLSYLARLPVDTLKIDRSFITDMTASPEGLSLVSTIINLAHSLKLNVVAEGVETEEQARLLRLLGCDEMQGFLFSKPVPREIFEVSFLASVSGN